MNKEKTVKNFHEESKLSSNLQERHDEKVETKSENIEHSMTQKRVKDNSSDCTKEMKNLHGAVALMIMPEKSFHEQEKEEQNKNHSRPVSAQSVTSCSLSLKAEMAYTELTEKNDKENLTTRESTALFQTCIPHLPIEIAVICLIFNILLPGFGSILCGVSNFCCGKMQKSVKKDDAPMKVLINLLVGLMQLLTVTFLLVGWFWSIAWGIKILLLSIENRKKMKQLITSKNGGIKFAYGDATAAVHHNDNNDIIAPKH